MSERQRSELEQSACSALGLERGLIIRQPHIGKILDGIKTWEMRSKPTNVRGMIALIEAGTGMIVGEAELTDCLEPFEGVEDAMAYQCYHQVDDLGCLKKWRYPWKLEGAVRYETPIPYKHPTGAVIWVSLQNRAVS